MMLLQTIKEIFIWNVLQRKKQHRHLQIVGAIKWHRALKIWVVNLGV